MQEKYTQEMLIVEKSEVEKEEELISSILKAKHDLEISRRNFEYANSTDLVDYYIYQIKANQSKMDYLIKLAKSRGLMVNMINGLEIKLENRAG